MPQVGPHAPPWDLNLIPWGPFSWGYFFQTPGAPAGVCDEMYHRSDQIGCSPTPSPLKSKLTIVKLLENSSRDGAFFPSALGGTRNSGQL